jgi:Na+/H+-dicarboxylate symporter
MLLPMLWKNKETRNILLSLIFGFGLGLILHTSGQSDLAQYLKPVGKVFITLLKMMIVPLVLSSIYMSVIKLGSPEKLGNLGIKAIIYYTATTALAAFIGLIMVNLFQPGSGLEIESMEKSAISEKIQSRIDKGSQNTLFQTILNVFIDAIPSNPFAAMAEMKILQIIVFAILMGIAALFLSDRAGPLNQFMGSLEEVCMKLVHIIMKIAPLGIFCLAAVVLAESGTTAITALGKYMITVLAGLLVHFIILGVVGTIRHKISPIGLIKGVGPAVLTAFSTSSSAATLPITMANVEDNLDISNETSQFVLPLGATINMDGTALYESVAVIFIGQAYGLDLSFATQMIIFLTASLAAVGAAAIPGAGLVTMSIVLTAVGFPLDGIGLILAVDRILDMFRTSVNVFGDCVGCVVVESFSKKGSAST